MTAGRRFAASPEIQERYTVAFRNQFQVLEEDDNGAMYSKFVEANQQAMEEYVPQKPKRKSVHTSKNPQVVAARQKADEAHTKWNTDGSDDDRAAWKLALNKLYETYDQVKEQELEGHSCTIEAAFGAQQYGEL